MAAFANHGGFTLPGNVDGAVHLALDESAEVADPPAFLQMFVSRPDRCSESKSAMSARYDIAGQIASTLTSFRIEPENQPVTPEGIAIHPSGPELRQSTLDPLVIELTAPLMSRSRTAASPCKTQTARPSTGMCPSRTRDYLEGHISSHCRRCTSGRHCRHQFL